MTDRQSTHSHDCWGWGPKHYECAVRQVERLCRIAEKQADRIAALEAELARLQEDKARLEQVQSDVLANLDAAPDDMDVISAAHFVAGSLSTAEEALEAAQAEARELRAELARVRELCPEVIAFAHLMQHKLNMNAHRDSSGNRGWKSCSPQFLMDKLYEEVLELTIAIHEGDSAKSIRQEAADVGNIAMMLADVCGALSQPAPAPEQLIELLSENLDTLSEEELLDECSEDFGSIDVMENMFDDAVTKATAQASPTKSLTFIQGVLCSLSILDGYGDSIAYREVADPHDPNQLWEEADEFDREHLARHGYRPTPAAQESGDA